MTTLLADYLTLTAADRPVTGYEHYETWTIMCPDDHYPEWFIYGDYLGADGLMCFEEVHGPFSTKRAAIHFLTHSLQRLCPRYATIIP